MPDDQSPPRLTILDDYQRIAAGSADWSAVRRYYDIETVTEHIDDESELARRLSGSEVIVAMRERTPFPARLLRQLPRLRLLVTTGMRNAAIDVDAARSQGVTVCGTASSGNAVAELTIGMMLALTRHIATEDATVRAGGWQHTIGPELEGKTLGVVGMGRIGSSVARLAHAFGMPVLAWSPTFTDERAREHGVEATSKAELLARSDIVTLHARLTPESRGLLGAPELATMKPTAYLVNTSRGPLVDERALIEALRQRRIAGAALDVYDVEPLPADHPLRSLGNTLVLPHIGYVTTDGYRRWFGQVVDDVLAWVAGEPIRTL